MKHSHDVYDSDHHFIIDSTTRNVSNANMKKTLLIQGDHNAERFTFELDKIIEGHDMTLCNKMEVHYINTETSKRYKNTGVYEIEDLQVSADDPNKVTFSWLISQQATMYAGSLSFLILFACVEEGETTYRWNTGINSSIVISNGINNGEVVIEVYPDILAQWKEELMSVNLAYKLAVEYGFEGTEEEWLRSLKGTSGIYVGEVEPDTLPYFWFDTSGNRNINTIFDLEGAEDSVVHINVEDEAEGIALANITLGDEEITENQYSFVIEE